MEEPGNPLPSERPSGTPPRVPPVTAEQRRAGGGVAAGPALRMPRPPALLPYIFWLCLRPETWAESARYKTRHIVRTVMFVIFATALLVGVTQTVAIMRQVQAFAATYDAHYSALIYKDGVLSAADPKKALPHWSVGRVTYAIDPTGKTPRPSNGMLINDRQIITHYDVLGFDRRQPIGELFDPGTFSPLIYTLPLPTLIDSSYLMGAYADNMLKYGLLLSISGALLWIAVNCAWTFLIAYLAVPFIQLAAPNLGVPRRVAYKMTLAITVPLTVLDAVLRSCGLALADTVGSQTANVIWMLALIGMAIFTGMLANQMYSRKPQKPRRAG